MIKKISALVIALVLCLSVVVMPASAAGVELGSNDIAFALEWDKKSYSAGDTAVLSVYMDARDDLSLFTGSFAIGLNSAVINQTDNPIATVKANATTADWFRAYYKGADTQLSWLSSSVVNTHIKDDNTAEENALYDHYLKFTAAKDTTGGSHANTGVNNAGFGGDEFIANEPIITISFTIASDVPDSTVVRAAITSGTLTASTLNFTQTKWKYYSNPGSATTTTDIYGTAASGALEQADTTVTNGGDVVIGGAELAFTTWKQQIKFGVDKDGAYNNTFSARTFVEFTNFSEVFDDAPDALNTDDGDGLLEVGFVYKVGDFDETTAKNYIASATFGVGEGTETSVDGYTIDRHAYISTTAKAGGYVMGSTIVDIPDANKTTNVTVLAYAKYTTGGEPVYAYHPVSGTFETLYNTYKAQAFPG